MHAPVRNDRAVYVCHEVDITKKQQCVVRAGLSFLCFILSLGQEPFSSSCLAFAFHLTALLRAGTHFTMRFTHFVSLLLSASAAVTYAAPLSRRAADFVDPHPGGGNMGAQDGGVREPINVRFPSGYVSSAYLLFY